MRPRRLSGALIGAICGLVAAATAAADPIAALNAQRAANGLPADIVENPEWSAACALHVSYLERNGFLGDWHDEIPGEPGYTVAGDAAAARAVLSFEPWRGAQNPWETAPLHLAQLLGPMLSVTGASDRCMYTWPGYQRPQPATLTILSYPGDGAAIYPSMTAREVPFVPGDFVGLPEGTKTGPHLYVFGFGAGTTGGTLSDAALTGPDGPVAVRVVDNHTPGLDGYLPSGGIIIPVAPLRANAVYTAQVTYSSDEGGRAARTWSFATAAAAVPAPASVSPPLPVTAGAVADGTPLVVVGGARPSVRLTLTDVGAGGEAIVTARGAAVGRRVRLLVRPLECNGSVCLAAGSPSVRTFTLTRRTRYFDAGPLPVRVTLSVAAFGSYRRLDLSRTLK